MRKPNEEDEGVWPFANDIELCPNIKTIQINLSFHDLCWVFLRLNSLKLHVHTSVFVGEGSMSEMLVEEVLSGAEVAHGRSAGLPVGAEAVDELVGQLGQLGCVVDGRGAGVRGDSTLQDRDYGVKTGAGGA